MKYSQKLVGKILIADDHPLVREGMATWLSQYPNLEICGEAESEDEAFALAKLLKPNLIIVDISLKSGNGIDLVKRIHTIDPAMKMLVVSAFQESIYAERALRAGAMGYVNKQAPNTELINAVAAIMSGNRFVSEAITKRLIDRALHDETKIKNPIDQLTDRELEIFRLIGEGVSSGSVADRLFLSTHTVDTYREKLKRKLNAKNAADLNRQAMIWVLENQ
jgi:DNA-binding NarL/FixJ family response regulator